MDSRSHDCNTSWNTRRLPGDQKANELDRYAVMNRTPFDYGPDGSLTIYMQHENPGPDKEANWLPAPEGEFRLALRLYVPDKRVVDRNWAPSPIQKVTE